MSVPRKIWFMSIIVQYIMKHALYVFQWSDKNAQTSFTYFCEQRISVEFHEINKN